MDRETGITNAPPFLPFSVAEISKACPACRETIQPPLWEEFDDPFTPIFPAGTNGEAGAWYRKSFTVRCNCGEQVDIPINSRVLGSTLYFYGDDGGRELRDWQLVSYSMIGGDKETIDKLSSDLGKLKQELVPDRSPDTWRIHTTELMNGHRRISHPVYKNVSTDKVLPFLGTCAAIIKNHGTSRWNHCSFGFFKRPSDKKLRRKVMKQSDIICHQAMLCSAIFRATEQSLRPDFYFDAKKVVKKMPHIEGWSFASHNGTRFYPAYAFLTHGNDIAPPTFLRPGSLPCLELADIHAFFVSRNLYQRALGQETEISTRAFGQFRYLPILGNNQLDDFFADEIPAKYIPNLT